MIYIIIFLSKIVENAISTLRLIIVANGKKLLGAILNLIVAVIWVISTYLVVFDITSDYYKIFFFAFGSFVGSYIGSIMEEKIAIGSNMLYVISNYNDIIKKELDSFNSYILNDNVLVIITSRKKRKNLLNVIRSIDNNCTIISSNAKELIFK